MICLLHTASCWFRILLTAVIRCRPTCKDAPMVRSTWYAAAAEHENSVSPYRLRYRATGASKAAQRDSNSNRLLCLHHRNKSNLTPCSEGTIA
jgi:hypothetical protein